MRIAYERAGQGPPLVLVHGFVGDGRSTWASQIDALSDEFTVVAWDGPGAGRSADPPEWFRLQDFADCLADFVAALGLRRPHIAGLSFGGAMILELYRRHPTVPRTLTLAGAYAGWAGSLPPEAVADRLRFCLDAAALPPEEFAAAMLPSMFAPSADPARVASFAAAVRESHPAGFRTMSIACAEADLRPMLGEVCVPTLVLSGDQDVRAPLDTARALHAAIPRSHLVVLDGVGHVSAVEAADRFNTEVRAFLHAADG